MKEEYQDIHTQLTIYQHGKDVSEHFECLTKFLTSKEQTYHLPIPNWLIQHRDNILIKCIPHIEDIKNYLIYHDCGKPYCLSIDINGKRHFPNHTQISQKHFLKYSNNLFIAELIGKDMLCHTTKPKDFEMLIHEEHIEILLLSALAAIHSNSIMFGGFESDSFKIKFKNLEKLGCRILNYKYQSN